MRSVKNKLTKPFIKMKNYFNKIINSILSIAILSSLWTTPAYAQPMLTCADITVLVEPEQTGREVWYHETIRTEGADLALFCDPPSGSVFTVGETDVHCTVTNPSGDTASCSFIVTVEKMPYDSLQPPAPLSPEGIFDRVRDRFGNPYRLSDLQIPETMGGALLCVNSGYFNLFFEPGCGMAGSSPVEVARRDVLCQLFSDLSQFIGRPAGATDKVNIWIRDISQVAGAGTNHLGVATPFFVLPATGSNGPFSGGIVEGEVWKTINAGVDSYTGVTSPLVAVNGSGAGYYHGMMAFNFANANISWHTTLTTMPVFNVYDLYSVGLHEAMHVLGFASLISASGNSVYAQNPISNFYSRYDTYLRTALNLSGGIANLPLITNTGACSQYNYRFNPALPPGILSPGSTWIPDYTDCVKAVRFTDASQALDQKTYTPNFYEGGSSLSHVEDGCAGLVWTPALNNFHFVMSNANGAGPAYMKRFLKPEERQVLCALGYAVGATYGNAAQLTFSSYSSGACPGIGVAGVNDGISPTGTFTNLANVNSPLSGINILGNDVAISYECLEPIYGGGTVFPTSGPGTFTYNAPSTPGIKVLRYVPVSASGKKGNITYVFIRVGGAGCPATACEMVSNGGFESLTGCCILAPAGAGVAQCWEPICGSPDVMARSCNTSVGCQTGVSTYSSIPPANTHNGAPNDNMLGLYASKLTSQPFSEAIQTQLATPLIPGQQYTLSFWALVNNNVYAPSSNVPAHVQFSTSAAPVAYMQPSAYPGGGLTPLLPNFVVSVNNFPTPNQWQYFTQTFTFSSSFIPHSYLTVAYPASTVATGIGAYVFLDDIKLAPVPNVPVFGPLAPVCQTDPPVNLNATVSIPGGVFTGPGVIPGYSFDPAVAGLGNHVITYTLTDQNGCTATATATILVAQGPSVFMLSLVPQCLSAPAINLNTFANPAGGTFSGPGVSCSAGVCSFSAANAGVGTHTITYTYTGGACPVSVSTSVQVLSCIDTCEISNRCLDFDGADDFVEAPCPLNTPVLQNNFTVACWFDDKTTGGPTAFHRLFGFGWDKRFEVGDRDGKLTFLNAVSTTVIRNTGWNHVAAVNSNGLVTIYLNGQSVPGLVGMNVGTFLGPPVNFRIGQWAFSLGQPHWQGKVDEFKVWGAVLTQVQIQEEMFCSLDPKNNLLLVHFPFDEYNAWGNNAGNSVVHNEVTGNLDGALTNFALTGVVSNWVGRERDLLPNCNVDHFAWIEGNNRGNYAGRSKVYDADIFTADQEIIPTQTNPLAAYPVFTRRGPDGIEKWRTRLQIEGSINDFIRTDEGCYLLVGYTPKFKLNDNNKSFIARIEPNGTLQWLHTYEFGDRESLHRIIRSENPSNPLYRYAVSGIVRTPGIPFGTYDDVLLFTVDNQGSIGWLRKLGDAAGAFTDDEFYADLINFQGGYALAGAYRNIQFYQPVIFRADNTGVQLVSSSQYQNDIFFTDIEPSSDGNGLIVAGQIGNGDALLARVDATGAQVWVRVFPNLLAFRRIVVQPNGDIFAVGQRDGSAPYRNVVVKARDSGTNVSILWQKHAELTPTGENNWRGADLAWYSGKMFFYTDTRFANNNGWTNGDIGATLYALDQSPDICPFTKDPSPVVQNYVLAKAQMTPLSGNLFTPPTPVISIPATTLNLLRDSLCPSYGCECDFVQMAFRKIWPIPVWNLPVSCGQAPVMLPGCPSQSSAIRFSGKLLCKGGCAFNGMSWTLTDPNGMQYTGTSSTATFSINLTLAMLQIPAPGVYTLTLTGQCGTKTCICTIQFTVPVCPPPCVCTQPAFTNAVNNGFNWVQLPGCNFKFTPKSLTTCDVVTWQVALSGSTTFTPFATGIGNQTVSYTFPATNQYVICMTVRRTPPGLPFCEVSRCWIFDVDCSLVFKPDENLPDNFSGNGTCMSAVVQNNGFTLDAEAGGLADVGTVGNWDYSAGNPEVLLEMGNADTNFVRMRGSGSYADLLYQDSLALTPWDSIGFSMALRPIHGLALPGTELVVRLSAQRQDSLWCNDDSTCLEVMRVPLPMLDTSIWLLAGSFATVKTVALPYLTIHVENPFIDDDVALQSIVDIDNVCLSRYDIVSVKQPWAGKGAMKIFPNPNTGTFSVKLPEAAKPGMAFRITDLTGRLLMEKQTEAGSVMHTVQAGDLPQGLYFLHVVSDDKVLGVEKFVKQ